MGGFLHGETGAQRAHGFWQAGRVGDELAGILVDISHVADKTFYDALEVNKAPLIASHSSCRALCDHVRDMSDDMIRALAAKGGVIQINYEKSFIDQAF